MQKTTVVKINRDADRLAKLKAELLAIELWDREHWRATRHTRMDDDSRRSRQKRGDEILNEIAYLQQAGIHTAECSDSMGNPKSNLRGF